MLQPDDDIRERMSWLLVDETHAPSAGHSVIVRSVAKFIFVLIVVVAHATTMIPPANAGSPELLEEVVVSGRFPGPPLWKVSSGDHVLWILPLIDLYPRKMEWESARVEKLIAQSQEFIQRPASVHGLSISANPVMLLRLRGLYKRTTYLPDGKKLKDVLPAELYVRFTALKARYFPRAAKIETMSVGAASRSVQQEVLDHENLQILGSSVYTPQLITAKLNRWLNRNKAIRRTSVSEARGVALTSADVKTLNDLMDEVLASPGFPEAAVSCFETVLNYFEGGLASAKKRANAWARGNADDLVGPTRPYVSESCRNPESVLQGHPAVEELRRNNPRLADFLLANRLEDQQRSKAKWVAAAQTALSRNATTFSVLEITDILEKDGLVAQLREKGYTVEVSAE